MGLRLILRTVIGHCGGVALVALGFWLVQRLLGWLYPSDFTGWWAGKVDEVLIFIAVTGLGIVFANSFIRMVVSEVTSAWKNSSNGKTRVVLA